MELAEARALVKDKTEKDITVRHLISVEGVMRALAGHFGEDEDRWALAGLFHDLDQDQTGEDSDRHAHLAAEWLLWSLQARLGTEMVQQVPFTDAFGGLPYEYLSPGGDRFISAAGWVGGVGAVVTGLAAQGAHPSDGRQGFRYVVDEVSSADSGAECISNAR